jgi:hypothetical protein
MAVIRLSHCNWYKNSGWSQPHRRYVDLLAETQGKQRVD